MQPTAIVQVFEEPLDITGVLNEQIMVHAVRAGDRLAGVAPEKTCTCACATDTRGGREFGCHLQERVPHPSGSIDPIENILWHSLAIEIDQAPGRNAGSVVDVAPRPGDGAGVLVESLRDGHGDGLGKLHLQRSESDRLIGTTVRYDLRESLCRSCKRAGGGAGSHPTLRSVALELSISVKGNSFRDQGRRVTLGNQRDLRNLCSRRLSLKRIRKPSLDNRHVRGANARGPAIWIRINRLGDGHVGGGKTNPRGRVRIVGVHFGNPQMRGANNAATSYPIANRRFKTSSCSVGAVRLSRVLLSRGFE